jgi:hypothetical protein
MVERVYQKLGNRCDSRALELRLEDFAGCSFIVLSFFLRGASLVGCRRWLMFMRGGESADGTSHSSSLFSLFLFLLPSLVAASTPRPK